MTEIRELHVVPTGDSVEHGSDAECVCQPYARVSDGGIVWVHSSLDGRELAEPTPPNQEDAMTTEEALETVREALTFRSSDPDDTHDALAALDTLVSRLKEAEGKLRIVKDAHRRVSPDGEWTFPVTLKPNEVADIISFLSTPPNQEGR